MSFLYDDFASTWWYFANVAGLYESDLEHRLKPWSFELTEMLAHLYINFTSHTLNDTL